MNTRLSTGLAALDALIQGLRPGDNVVWQVQGIDDYLAFVIPYAEAARRAGKRLTYFRFARHQPLVGTPDCAEVRELNPQEGFERFLQGIHRTIEGEGSGAWFLFDSLSGLAADWFSDQMLANFFRLTCPYLYDMADIAYFALLRNQHSFHATTPIRQTTQLLLDVYRHRERLHLRPMKMEFRDSAAEGLLHRWQDDGFVPVTDSRTLAEIQSSAPRSALESAISRLDVWNRTFLNAEEALLRGGISDESVDHRDQNSQRLLRMVISRHERVLGLARRYLELESVLAVGRRTIGTGLIGGKSVGMLLARSILEHADSRWKERLEAHDSFFIASDVFYTYLVQCGSWWIRQAQSKPQTFLNGAAEAREAIRSGVFPREIERQFAEMLDYFGPFPIVVRSSSLLEDNFGNSFAGKYDSVFCANQGTSEERLACFLDAVRAVYASSMSEEALHYRERHGLLDRDEQMALLVQRVSGEKLGETFQPQLAGVGYSFNPFAWSEEIEPEAGMLRVVYGLGTRAVERSDNDYTRIIALNAPQRRPESARRELRRYSQRRVDVIDLVGNQVVTRDFVDMAASTPALHTQLFTTEDREIAQFARHGKAPRSAATMLTFDRLIDRTSFIADMRDMLRTLEAAYEYPVEIEFTANFVSEQDYSINLLQCRPLQVKGSGPMAPPPPDVSDEDILFQTNGPVIGHSRTEAIQRLILVIPSEYARLDERDRHAVARLIGKLNRASEPAPLTLLMGPGRWGTASPSLGVPVTFAEISNIAVLCEIVAMSEDLVPDVSMGTHFLSELVEMDMLYLAVFPRQGDHVYHEHLVQRLPNRLLELAPESHALSRVVHVADVDGAVRLHADCLRQRVICYCV